MICPNCGKEINEEVQLCPFCNADIQRKEQLIPQEKSVPVPQEKSEIGEH